MRFQNLDPNHRRPSRLAAWRRLLIDRGLRRGARPPDGPPAHRVAPDLSTIHAPEAGPQATWIGHASVLLQIGSGRVLIDPVFSESVGWLSRRHAAPGLGVAQLPPIDLLVVTHNHYDHLDSASIAALPRSATVVVPSGLGRCFCRLGFARVIELGWWESTRCGETLVTCVPARHWSRRGLFDTNATLWGGFVFEAAGTAVYHAGDSAWFDGFAEIGRRFPHLAAALLPIGGYSPRWFMQHNHMTPEEAGAAFQQLGAQVLLPIHWGTFRLSDEPLCEPIDRLQDWWELHPELGAERLINWSIGQTLALKSPGENR